MRILFLSPVNPKLTPGEPLPRWQMQASWVRALARQGHEVRVVKYTPDKRIRLEWGERIWRNIRAIREIGPAFAKASAGKQIGLIIYSLGADVLLPGTIHYIKAKLGAPLAVLSGVSPIKQGNPRERAMAPLVDLAATNDQGHGDEWLGLGAKRTVVLPIAAVDPELHYPRNTEFGLDAILDGVSSIRSARNPRSLRRRLLDSEEVRVLSGSSSMISETPSSTRQKLETVLERDIDVLFAGTLTPERRRFFDRLRKLLPDRVKMVVKEFVWEEEYAELMSRAKIGINLLRPEMKLGANLRTFEIPAFGAMEITGFCRQEWLAPGKEVEVFRSAEEAAGLVKKYLRNDEARQKMAEAGRKRVIKEHTFDKRVEKLMEMISVSSATLDGVSSIRSARNPRSLRRRLLDSEEVRVLSGSSSMISETPSSVRSKLKTNLLDVSVCIVNYKTDRELERCVESIRKFTTGVSYEIIVIDNSTDNRWYSGGNNLAIGQARGKYVLFLNPDCWVTSDVISELVSFMDKHPRVGAVEPRQVDSSGEILPTGSLTPKWWIDLTEMTGLSKLFGRLGQSGVLGGLGRLGQLGELDKYRQVEFDRRENWRTEVVSGAAAMVRKDILDEIGGFDERLKLYYTDVDLCRRVKNSGFEIWHVGEAALRHKTRSSTSKLPWDRVNFIYARDARGYYRKWGEKVGGEILYWAMRGNGAVIKLIK